MFVADESMRYVAVNRTACETLGYRREELLERTVTDVAVAGDAPDLWRTMLRKGVASGTTTLRRKDGTELRFRYAASEAVVAHMTVWVSVGVVV